MPRLSPIRSLAYFLPAIEELLADPSSDNYLDYLRIKLNRILDSKEEDTDPASADIQKSRVQKIANSLATNLGHPATNDVERN